MAQIQLYIRNFLPEIIILCKDNLKQLLFCFIIIAYQLHAELIYEIFNSQCYQSANNMFLQILIIVKMQNSNI